MTDEPAMTKRQKLRKRANPATDEPVKTERQKLRQAYNEKHKGRPPRTDMRTTHTTRLRAPVREKLKAAAAVSGLSISEEIERRTEASFDVVDQLSVLLANIVRMAAALTGKSWAEDRYTRELTFGLIMQGSTRCWTIRRTRFSPTKRAGRASVFFAMRGARPTPAIPSSA